MCSCALCGTRGCLCTCTCTCNGGYVALAISPACSTLAQHWRCTRFFRSLLSGNCLGCVCSMAAVQIVATIMWHRFGSRVETVVRHVVGHDSSVCTEASINEMVWSREKEVDSGRGEAKPQNQPRVFDNAASDAQHRETFLSEYTLANPNLQFQLRNCEVMSTKRARSDEPFHGSPSRVRENFVLWCSSRLVDMDCLEINCHCIFFSFFLLCSSFVVFCIFAYGLLCLLYVMLSHRMDTHQ
jgi:hypothetical protein